MAFTVSAQQVLPLNGSGSGAFNPAHTEDWWSITIPQDGSLKVDIVSDAALELDSQIYDSDKATVVAQDRGWGPNSTMTFPNFRPGTYYIRPYRYSGEGNYSISNTFTPANLANDPEPNDTPQQARAIAPNSTSTGHIGFYGSGYTDLYDWCSVELPQDGSIDIAVTRESDSEVIDCELYAPDGATEIARSHNWEPTERILVPNLMPGKYFLRIFRYANFSPYTVVSKFTPQPTANDIEPNDTPETAQAASTFMPQRGHLFYSTGLATDIVDWFRFTMRADGSLWLNVVNDETIEADMELYKADGTTEISRDHGWGPVSKVGADELLAGEYLFRIVRYSGYGAYTITPASTQYYVNVLGPTVIVPGELVTYVIRYANPLDYALNDVVVTADLPNALNHAGNTGHGIFYTGSQCANQTFWKLGTLAPGTKGELSFTITAPWGTPNADTSIYARMSASNFPGGGLFDVAPYLAFTGYEASAEWNLSQQEIGSTISSNPALKALYDKVIAGGYKFFGTAVGWVMPVGGSTIRFYFLQYPDRSPAVLTWDGSVAFMEKYLTGSYTIFDIGGGYTWDLDQGKLSTFGPSGEISPLTEEGFPEGLREARCQFNCTLNQIPEMAVSKVHAAFEAVNYIKDCAVCAASMRSGETDYVACASCTAQTAENSSVWVAEKVPGIGTAVEWTARVAKCLSDCIKNPDLHICTEDKWDCGCLDPIGWLAGIESKCHTVCNKTTGTYAPLTYRIQCATEERCSDGKCVDKNKVCSGPACKPKTVKTRPSHDPNAKHVDFLGEVLPGQRLTYTLEYENTGSGTAFGVFILDTLDKNLDAATLVINDGGSYSPSARMLDFEVGDVPPGGKGEVSFSVCVKADATNGTEIVNAAEVYFPNALEVTPTNGVANRVATVAADPKTASAIAGEPVQITLSGRSAAGGAISYQITAKPSYGELSGAPPSVTYTSNPQFIGVDTFQYTAGDGPERSTPAEVRITVGPNPDDRTPPFVLSTFPADGAVGISPDPNPIATDPLQYSPAITAAMSEPLDPASLTDSSLVVEGLTGTVSYDGVTKTLSFIPGVAITAPKTYTAKVMPGVRDLAGNAMQSEHEWTFSTAGGTPGDCDGNGTVSIGEVQKAINMFLGAQAPGCGVDCNGDGKINIGEVQKVINAFLGLPSSC